MDDVITAERLTKRFGSFTAVKEVSLRVGRGECFGLLGPNGAGKTTTIRMLYGYTPVSGGNLSLFGEGLGEVSRRARYRIGVCQQEDNLDPDLPVRENLLVFARYFDLPRRRAEEEADRLLRFFALEGRAGDNIRELSGGLKRRLVLARALIHDPDLVILDEPTTGLDPQSRHQVWQRLEELKRGGLTILLTTHYMEEAARLCDRLVIIDRGEVLVEGSPAELVSRHVGREVIEVAEPEEGVRGFLSGRKSEWEDLGHRLVIYGKAEEGLFGELKERFPGSGCSLRGATLEDVFLRLTGRELRD